MNNPLHCNVVQLWGVLTLGTIFLRAGLLSDYTRCLWNLKSAYILYFIFQITCLVFKMNCDQIIMSATKYNMCDLFNLPVLHPVWGVPFEYKTRWTCLRVRLCFWGQGYYTKICIWSVWMCAFLCCHWLFVCRYHLYIMFQSFVAAWFVYDQTFEWTSLAVWEVTMTPLCEGQAVKSDAYISPQRQGSYRTTNNIGLKTFIAIATWRNMVNRQVVRTLSAVQICHNEGACCCAAGVVVWQSQIWGRIWLQA